MNIDGVCQLPNNFKFALLFIILLEIIYSFISSYIDEFRSKGSKVKIYFTVFLISATFSIYLFCKRGQPTAVLPPPPQNETKILMADGTGYHWEDIPDLTSYSEGIFENEEFFIDGTELVIDRTIGDKTEQKKVDLSKFLDNTDNQSLYIKNDTLYLSKDDGTYSTIDLSKYLDDTDDQNLSLDDNNLILTRKNYTSATVDLSKYIDTYYSGSGLSLDSNTFSVNAPVCSENQALSWDGSQFLCKDISSSSGGSTSSPQTLSYDTGSYDLSISDGNTVNLSNLHDVYNAGDGLDLATNTFSVDSPICAVDERLSWNGNNFVCEALPANTDSDNQTLSFNTSTYDLSISGGNTTSLSALHDEYTAGNGLSLSSNEFAVDSPVCTGNEHLTWNGTNFQCTDISGMKGYLYLAGGTSGERIDQTLNLFYEDETTGEPHFGVGTDNPQYTLDVDGTFHLSGHLFDANSSPGANGYVLTSSPTGVEWADPASLSGSSSPWTQVGSNIQTTDPNAQYVTLGGQSDEFTGPVMYYAYNMHEDDGSGNEVSGLTVQGQQESGVQYDQVEFAKYARNFYESEYQDKAGIVSDRDIVIASVGWEPEDAVQIANFDPTIYFKIGQLTGFGGRGTPETKVLIDKDGDVGIKIADDDADEALQVGENGDGTRAVANSWDTFSDIRFKKDIYTIPNSLDKVLKLNGVHFKWKTNDKDEIGFIAQDVQKVVPEVVHSTKKGFLSVAYDKITALLVNAIKELNAKIENILARLDILEKRTDAGSFTIPASTVSTTVWFDKQKDKTPFITVTCDVPVNVAVVEKNSKNFKIQLDKSYSKDIHCDFTAVIK